MSVLVKINIQDQSFSAIGLQLVANQVTTHRGDRWGGTAPRIELDVSSAQIAQFVERFAPALSKAEFDKAKLALGKASTRLRGWGDSLALSGFADRADDVDKEAHELEKLVDALRGLTK